MLIEMFLLPCSLDLLIVAEHKILTVCVGIGGWGVRHGILIEGLPISYRNVTMGLGGWGGRGRRGKLTYK